MLHTIKRQNKWPLCRHFDFVLQPCKRRPWRRQKTGKDHFDTKSLEGKKKEKGPIFADGGHEICTPTLCTYLSILSQVLGGLSSYVQSGDGNETSSTLTFAPRAEDDGRDLRCVAAVPDFAAVDGGRRDGTMDAVKVGGEDGGAVEDKLRLSVMCKYSVLYGLF